ncbi:MAG: hypothetical protein ABIV06_03680, partial [Thermoanaerobaculia bacterium]
WLLRLRAAGLVSRFVPNARAVHLFAQSSVQEPRAATWFAEAERLFRRRHLGAGIARILEALRPRAPRPSLTSLPPRESLAAPALALSELGLAQRPAWIEVALSPGGFPAAGEALDADSGDWQLPDEVWRRLPRGDLWLRGIDAAGRESAPLHLRRGTAAGPDPGAQAQ